MKHSGQGQIPIVIGVTGHRDPKPSCIPAIRSAVSAQLAGIKKRCPHSPLILLTSLAEGGDQLCAQEAEKLGIPIVAALPRALADFRGDFTGEALESFDRLAAAAKSVFVAPRTEKAPATPSLEDGYRQAGIYLARHSHVLIALWDGYPPIPGGCGTAEAVDFMQNGSYQNADGALFKKPGAAVISIHTPRLKRPSQGEAGAVTLHETTDDAFLKLLSETDGYNAQAERYRGDSREWPLIGEPILSGLSPELLQLHGTYQTAGTLSLENRDRYLKTMRHLAFLSVGLVLSFLLYDELEANLFLPLYAILGLTALFLMRLAKSHDYHERYLAYRALAESLRVQFYLLLSGITVQVSDSFTWSQKCEEGWIGRAVDGLLIGAQPTICDPAIIQKAWIEEQLAYHKGKSAPTKKRLSLNDRVTQLTLFISIALFVLTLLLEFFRVEWITALLFPSGLPAFFLPHPDQGIALRGIIKILLGVSSAASLFMANYYGKLSLKQRLGDHIKMAALMEAALWQLESGMLPREEVLIHLAREEIIENGVWLSYCRDNVPSVSL